MFDLSTVMYPMPPRAARKAKIWPQQGEFTPCRCFGLPPGQGVFWTTNCCTSKRNCHTNNFPQGFRMSQSALLSQPTVQAVADALSNSFNTPRRLRFTPRTFSYSSVSNLLKWCDSHILWLGVVFTLSPSPARRCESKVAREGGQKKAPLLDVVVVTRL